MTDQLNRIKFYDSRDLSLGLNVKHIEDKFKSIQKESDIQIRDVNDALELANALHIIEKVLLCPDSVYDKQKWARKLVPLLYRKLNQYFAQFTKSDIIQAIQGVDFRYPDDLLVEFVRHDFKSRISEAELERVLDKSPISLRHMLANKQFVEIYPNLCKQKFLSQPKNFELLLHNLEDNHQKHYYLPECTGKELRDFCLDYIQSEHAHPNYLELLAQPITGIEHYFDHDNEIKLAAQRKSKALWKKLLKEEYDSQSSEYGFRIFSSQSAYEKALKTKSDNEAIALVDAEWIKRYPDFPTLWNNLQYQYGFFTPELISALPSFRSDRDILMEALSSSWTKKSYRSTMSFEYKQQIACGQVEVFRDILASQGIQIEKLFTWFFDEYCPSGFGIKWAPFAISAAADDERNKIGALFHIEEFIRKQYQCLSDHGGIEADRINLMEAPRFEELTSQVKNKYAYLKKDSKLHGIAHLLFSSQSGLCYINHNLHGEDFLDLITRNDVQLSDFHQYQQPKLQFLLERGIIAKNNKGNVVCADIPLVKTMFRLYNHGVVSYHHVTKSEQVALEQLSAKGEVFFENTLFSRPESQYLNFLTNNTTFDNSWAIRNKYSHGFPIYANEYHYRFDYCIALLILIIQIVKINDELTLRQIQAGKEPPVCQFA